MPYKEKYNMPEAVVVLTRLKIIACKKCPKGFTKKKEYKLHKLKHDLLNMQKQRKEERKIFYHKNSNIKGFEKRIQCEECDMKFVEKSTLEAHSVLHKPFPHICKCGVGFYVREDLKCHMKIVHVEQRGRKTKKKEPKNMILIGSKKNKKSLNSCESEI